MSNLQIDVWSDIACPWCWVGKRHLEQALGGVKTPITLIWRAFELNPSAPRQVEDPSIAYAERLARKYRVSASEGQAMIDRMTEVGKGVGIDFRFDRLQPTNTFDAHRLLSWAIDTGRQDALKEALFRAYMTDGELVGDHAVLVRCAQSVGLDPEEAQLVLESNDHAETVRDEQRGARQMGVGGVPFFVLGQRYALSGAQPPEVIAGAIREALAHRPLIDVTEGDAEACGPDGCDIEPGRSGTSAT